MKFVKHCAMSIFFLPCSVDRTTDIFHQINVSGHISKYSLHFALYSLSTRGWCDDNIIIMALSIVLEHWILLVACFWKDWKTTISIESDLASLFVCSSTYLYIFDKCGLNLLLSSYFSSISHIVSPSGKQKSQQKEDAPENTIVSLGVAQTTPLPPPPPRHAIWTTFPLLILPKCEKCQNQFGQGGSPNLGNCLLA